MLLRLFSLILGVLALNGVSAQGYSNVAVQQGIQYQYTGAQYGGGISFYDVDGDGWDDITLGTASSGVLFYKNNNGEFAPGVYLLTLNTQIKQLLWADYDNDGDADLFVTNFNAPNRLYRNNGSIYNLEDVTVQAGLPLTSAMTFGCGFSDYDRDSDLDLYVCNYNNSVYSNYFYQNNGDGTFTDITTSAGVGDGYCYSFLPLFADFNNDMWSDLFVINDRTECSNSYWKNDQGTFVNQTQASGLVDNFFAMNNSAADYDLDGDLDIYVSNNPTGNRLYNNTNATFSNVASEAGVLTMDHSWASVWVDFDHDMDEDLYVSCSPFWGQPGQNRFYINQGNGTFFEGTSSSGFTGDTGSSHAAAVGDYNNDGNFDIFSVNDAPAYSRFFRSAESNNHWIKVTLEGVESNRDGIGTWIEAYAGGVKQIRFTHCGEGYMSQNSKSEIIGLAQNEIVDSLIIRWPSGIIDRFYDVQKNQSLNILEGSSADTGITTSDFQLCENGSVTLVGYGGVIYEWNNGVVNDTLIVTEPGTYFFTGYTAWGNSFISESVTIVGAPSIAAEIQTTNESCIGMNDGIVVINSSNGMEFSAIYINGLESNGTEELLAPGEYQLELYNSSGCMSNHSFIIEHATPIDITLNSGTIECYGETTEIEVIASGGNGGYVVDWNSIDPLNIPAGEYELSVLDELGCSSSISFSILQPDYLEIEIEVEAFTNDNAGTLELEIEGGTPPFIIQTFGPTGYFANSAYQTDLLPGNYTWIVVDANGCSISGNTSIDDLSIGVNELNKQAITIYPNPASESIGIQTTCNVYALKIRSCDGRIIENFCSNQPITHIDVSAFAPGVYLLDIATSCGNTIRKFAVQ